MRRGDGDRRRPRSGRAVGTLLSGSAGVGLVLLGSYALGRLLEGPPAARRRLARLEGLVEELSREPGPPAE